jgi:hypothetical protein
VTTNGTFASGVRTYSTTYAEDMDLFDTLPPEVRAVMREFPISMHSIGVKRTIWSFGTYIQRPAMIRGVLQAIEKFEREDLRKFDAEHRRRHGYQLPHIAAGATVQTAQYGAKRPPAKRTPARVEAMMKRLEVPEVCRG